MNIFVLDKDPWVAAHYLNDRHIVKMCLESAQILSTVSWRYEVPAPYKETHKSHPVVLWAGETYDNWLWLVAHGFAIGLEYHKRYGKIHKSSEVINWCYWNGGRPIRLGLTEHCRCMPEEFKIDSIVESYRNYYRGAKKTFSTWKNPTQPPFWMNND